MWSVNEYHSYSPGQQNVERFLGELQPKAGSSLVDIGCGSGGAGLALKKAGLDVWWVDITDQPLLPEVDRARFINKPLWEDWHKMPRTKDGNLLKYKYDYGFCCDVMEHIPPEFVMLTLNNILRFCDVTWLVICNQPDNLGSMIGQTLHTALYPYTWWRDRISMLGTVEDARDLCGLSLFVVRS